MKGMKAAEAAPKRKQGMKAAGRWLSTAWRAGECSDGEVTHALTRLAPLTPEKVSLVRSGCPAPSETRQGPVKRESAGKLGPEPPTKKKAVFRGDMRLPRGASKKVAAASDIVRQEYEGADRRLQSLRHCDPHSQDFLEAAAELTAERDVSSAIDRFLREMPRALAMTLGVVESDDDFNEFLRTCREERAKELSVPPHSRQ